MRRIDDLLLSSASAQTPATVYTDPPTTHHGHFLPGNPMPYMAPSATHQPELLLLTWMITTITSIVEDLQHHPIVHDPIPAMSSFTNTSAYRLYLQLRNALRHLINTTHDIQRGLHILQFLPGSPGSPGHYRMDPTIHFTPGHSNYLSSSFQSTITPAPPPADTQSPPPTPLLRQLHRRDRSRSRDRLPITTHADPHLYAQPIALANITPATTSQRRNLHHALWTASTTPSPCRSPPRPSPHHY